MGVIDSRPHLTLTGGKETPGVVIRRRRCDSCDLIIFTEERITEPIAYANNGIKDIIQLIEYEFNGLLKRLRNPTRTRQY